MEFKSHDHPRVDEETLRRFWVKVEKGAPDTCWEWLAGKSKGYGQFQFEGKTIGAYRASYIIHHGPIPKGLHILHSCDNPGCVNPAHLSADTHAENMRQHWDRGSPHLAQGSDHVNAKLTEDDVMIIMELASAKVSQRDIAQRFGVTQTTITDIARGKTWNHVTGKPPYIPAADRKSGADIRRGERHGRAKLTESDVAEILELLPTTTQATLARKFQVTTGMIWRIAHNKAWTHVPRPPKDHHEVHI